MLVFRGLIVDLFYRDVRTTLRITGCFLNLHIIYIYILPEEPQITQIGASMHSMLSSCDLWVNLHLFFNKHVWINKFQSWWFQWFFIFTPPGEMIQFHKHSFQMGWNHQLETGKSRNNNNLSNEHGTPKRPPNSNCNFRLHHCSLWRSSSGSKKTYNTWVGRWGYSWIS